MKHTCERCKGEKGLRYRSPHNAFGEWDICEVCDGKGYIETPEAAADAPVDLFSLLGDLCSPQKSPLAATPADSNNFLTKN